MPAPNGSNTAVDGTNQLYEEHPSEWKVQTLTETREHPVEQMRRGKERRGLGNDVGYRGVEEHGGEVDMALVCRVVVMVWTLGAGKDDDE